MLASAAAPAASCGTEPCWRAGLVGRPLGTPAPPLPLRVQLQASGGACFESTIGAAGTSQNANGAFKGKSTGP